MLNFNFKAACDIFDFVLKICIKLRICAHLYDNLQQFYGYLNSAWVIFNLL